MPTNGGGSNLGLGQVVQGIVDAVSDWWSWNFAGGKEQAELERLRLEQEALAQQVAAEKERTIMLVAGGLGAVALAAWAMRKG